MIRQFLTLTVSIVALISLSNSASASVCTIPDSNGYCIPGLVEGSYPYFDTAVKTTWDTKDNTLIASFDSSSGSGNDSTFFVSPTESYTVTSTQLDFDAVLDLVDMNETGNTAGAIEIWGHIGPPLDINDPPRELLMSADLTGRWRQDATDMSVVGFNTENIFCHASIEALVNCTASEVVYLDLDEAYDFSPGQEIKGHTKTKTAGAALTSVPLPAAVWLFGFGLLGLVGVARRKKAA